MAMRKSRYLAWVYTFLIYVFMYLPIVVVIIFSFNKGRFAIWTGFDLKWYKLMLGNKEIISAAVNSLILAVAASTIATVLGTVMALALTRFRFVGRRVLNGGVYLLTVSPDIVMGISLLIIFILVNVPLGFITLLISHVVLCTPFVVVTLMGRIQKMDEDLVSAARDLGASETRAFLHVILPLLLPAVAAGWLLSFTLSMDDVLISFFVQGAGFEILPLRIYSMVKLGVKPDINALSTIMFVVTVILVLAAQILLKTRRQ